MIPAVLVIHRTFYRFETVAPRHGFEPRFTAPKAAVLPLDDRGISTGDTISLASPQGRCNDSATIIPEANLGRRWARASNPLCGTCVVGGFDSHWLPPPPTFSVHVRIQTKLALGSVRFSQGRRTLSL